MRGSPGLDPPGRAGSPSGRLRKLDGLVQRLRDLSETPRSEFLADEVRQAAAERTLRVPVQVVLDLGAHVPGERGDLDAFTGFARRIEELL